MRYLFGCDDARGVRPHARVQAQIPPALPEEVAPWKVRVRLPALQPNILERVHSC